MTIAFLLVTCCREQSRTQILSQVIDNIEQQAPTLLKTMTVFDNESTDPVVSEMLTSKFSNVKLATPNLGYWSAINWWLENLASDPPQFTYVIESDMIHFAFDKIWQCEKYLQKNPDVGSIRLHEYSVENRHLYNKDVPTKGSRTTWQSHTNKATGKPISIDPTHTDGIHKTNFLTQLPALNRYESMCRVFKKLLEIKSFTELDFQRLYHEEHNVTGILDGGIFHCDSASFGTKAITGSWTSKDELKRLGYLDTRFATITPSDQYKIA